jgi:hypothetical protein
VIQDPPGVGYLEAILIAIRNAGQRLAAMGGYLGSAERASIPAWKWQLLTAAGHARSEAHACLDEADERLSSLGAPDSLPAPLDALPERVRAMRKDLRAVEEQLEEALAAAAESASGNA